MNKFFKITQKFKKISGFLSPFIILIVFSVVSYASDIDMDNPSLGDMKTILIRIMNWTVFLVGIAFVAVLGYGAWKASTATGDPRALDSAKSTWTYALFGALVVVAFFGLFTIAAGWFGIKIGFDDIFGNIFGGIEELVGDIVNPPKP